MINLAYGMSQGLPFSALMEIDLQGSAFAAKTLVDVLFSASWIGDRSPQILGLAEIELSRGANAREALVEFHDRRTSKRSAFVSNEQNRTRKFRENATPSSALFADDKGSFPIETDHELKWRRIAETKVGVGAHSKLLHRSA